MPYQVPLQAAGCFRRTPGVRRGIGCRAIDSGDWRGT